MKVIKQVEKIGFHSKGTKNRMPLQIWQKANQENDQWGCQETHGNIKGAVVISGK